MTSYEVVYKLIMSKKGKIKILFCSKKQAKAFMNDSKFIFDTLNLPSKKVKK